MKAIRSRVESHPDLPGSARASQCGGWFPQILETDQSDWAQEPEHAGDGPLLFRRAGSARPGWASPCDGGTDELSGVLVATSLARVRQSMRVNSAICAACAHTSAISLLD